MLLNNSRFNFIIKCCHTTALQGLFTGFDELELYLFIWNLFKNGNHIQYSLLKVI